MKRFAALIAPFALAAAPAMAEPVVVELFASKNCAACPKAYDTLNTLQTDSAQDMLVLTWAVDYWDYLDTPDMMALPESKTRQDAYVERFGLRGPYTPQTVYDGAVQCPGTKTKRVKKQLATRNSAEQADVQLTATETGVSVSGKLSAPADVWLVHYLPKTDSDAPNPVTRVEKLGDWITGEAAYDATCEDGCAVLVQASGIGEIWSAINLTP